MAGVKKEQIIKTEVYNYFKVYVKEEIKEKICEEELPSVVHQKVIHLASLLNDELDSFRINKFHD